MRFMSSQREARRIVRCGVFLTLVAASGAARAGEVLSPSLPDSGGSAWPVEAEGSPGRVEHRVRLDRAERSVVRSGPGAGYEIAGVYDRSADFAVIAQSGDWFGLRLSEQETGWVHTSLCHTYDDLSGLEYRVNPRLYSRVGAFTLGAYTGGYAFDRKSNSLVAGGNLGYYVLDFVVVEAGLAWTHVHRPREVVESLFDLSLESEQFHMLSYHLDLRGELLPGRRVVPFVLAGAGASLFQGRSEPSVDLGAGALLFVNKHAALRWEFRDYRFHSGVGRSRRQNDNFEFSFGSCLLF